MSRLDQELDTKSTYRIRRWHNLAWSMKFERFMNAKAPVWTANNPPRRPLTGRPFDFRKHARSGPR